MKLLLSYESENSASQRSEKVESDKDLDISAVQSVYLITNSRVVLERFPTRNAFAGVIVQSCNLCNAKVKHWCCSQENHENGGIHYHKAISLDTSHKWFPAKQFLVHRYGIRVHFSNRHHNYHSAWKYVLNSDSRQRTKY